ncbi:hypothetical protein SAMN05421754_106011 [Nitrosomonas sp. Nm58]|nr:hypothetical protein SAMN05421754_106011 [Nitrosomonas sp. Nm58]
MEYMLLKILRLIHMTKLTAALLLCFPILKLEI